MTQTVWLDRIHSERRGSQFRLTPIPKCQILTAHHDPADFAGGHRVPGFIRQQNLYIFVGVPDGRDDVLDGCVLVEEGLAYVERFTGAVADVEDASGGEVVAIELDVRCPNGFAAESDQSQVRQSSAGRHRRRHAPEQRRYGVIEPDFQVVEPLDEFIGTAASGVERTQHRAVEQRTEQMHGRSADSERRQRRETIIRRHVGRIRADADVVKQIAMILQDTLGPTGRAGGVENACQMVRADRHLQRTVGLTAQHRVRIDNLHLVRGKLPGPFDDGTGRHHDRRPRLLKDRALSGQRSVWIDRHVTLAGDKDTENRRDHQDGVIQQQCDRLVRRVGAFQRRAGDTVGHPFQFQIGDRMFTVS